VVLANGRKCDHIGASLPKRKGMRVEFLTGTRGEAGALQARRKKRRFENLVFFIPIIVIVIAVTYQVLTSTYFGSGTLIVSAQTSGEYYTAKWLNVTAEVGVYAKGTTPIHASLPQGTYTVQFSPQAWFYTPPERTVSLPPGKTAYVVGVYDPIVRTVLIASNKFNSSLVSAGRDVTPVMFINMMSDNVLIQSLPSGRVSIPPAGNTTIVFPQTGRYLVYMPLVTDANVTISVT